MVSGKAIKELEEAKSVLAIAEGQPAPAERPGRLRRLQVYADKAKQEEITTEESLEAKGALLARGLEESKVHYVLLLLSLLLFDFLLCVCTHVHISIGINMCIMCFCYYLYYLISRSVYAPMCTYLLV